VRALLLVVATAAAASGCSPGGGGAAVVRWRLIDARTGAPAPGCEVYDEARRELLVRVDQIRLEVADAASGAPVACASCLFACAPLEGTTTFELPTGNYRFALAALRCGALVGDAPPPVVRSVQRGEITNLSAIGVTIPTCARTPAACPDADAGRFACADGGP